MKSRWPYNKYLEILASFSQWNGIISTQISNNQIPKRHSLSDSIVFSTKMYGSPLPSFENYSVWASDGWRATGFCTIYKNNNLVLMGFSCERFSQESTRALPLHSCTYADGPAVRWCYHHSTQTVARTENFQLPLSPVVQFQLCLQENACDSKALNKNSWKYLCGKGT